MWYKRFGYKQPQSNGAEMGCLGLIGVPILSLIFVLWLSIKINNGWLLFLVFPISIIGLEVCDRHSRNEGFRFRERRKQKYIKSAENSISFGAESEALEAIRKAKIYGDLPDNLGEFEVDKGPDKHA